MNDDPRLFGICGWSGSGKTTLIERMVPVLRDQGLKVAVVKHDAHGIDVDRPGKDSDRLFRAGANVLLLGPTEGFLRLHSNGSDDSAGALRFVAATHDLVLVEGHKHSPVPKVWLLGEREASPPPDVTQVVAVLPRDSDRLAKVLAIVGVGMGQAQPASPASCVR